SLLGVAIHRGVSFPVGKVDFLTLHPFDFVEFLMATQNEKWAQLIMSCDWEQQEIVSPELIGLLKTYMVVGGMPEVAVTYGDSLDLKKARLIQSSILQAYENDFSNHAPIGQLPRIRMIWQSIVGQLAKVNSKFIYSLMRSGARAKELNLPLNGFVRPGLLSK
ncbi:MAG: ATPase, partial [Flavobacteriales bacterium]